MISFDEAYQLTLGKISPLGTEKLNVAQATGRILAEDLFALVDSRQPY